MKEKRLKEKRVKEERLKVEVAEQHFFRKLRNCDCGSASFKLRNCDCGLKKKLRVPTSANHCVIHSGKSKLIVVKYCRR